MASQLRRRNRGRLVLLEGEQILYEIGHHWLAGVVTLVIPVGILLVFLSLFIYSVIGGGYTLEYRSPRLELDLLSWIFLGVVGFMGALWVLMGIVEREGYQGRRWSLVGLAMIVVAVIAYRAGGGEIFVPGAGGFNLLRPAALVLLLLTSAAGIVVFYLLIDLLADTLYLTNMRVVYFNGAVLIPRLIERQVQQDLMLEDVQNVLSRTETYLQHWLNFSNITVTAANAGAPIRFQAANEAKEMQRRIFGARGDLQKRQGARNFAQLINARVYDDKATKEPYRYTFPVFKLPFFARWALADNPTVNPAQGEVTWYAHWLFLARDLAWPLVTLVAVGALLFLAAAWALFGLWISALIALIALIGCGLWMAYLVEDYRNDRYIVTSSTIVDIDKRPFGPENRRTAALRDIQTVNLKTTFLSNILGYGDVVVQTAGKGGSFTFSRVPRPRDVAATINQHISNFRRGERERTLDESLSLLRQFHAYQDRLGELKQREE